MLNPSLSLLAQLRVSLSELDRRWDHIAQGKSYHGEAVGPKSTSLFEKLIGITRVCCPAPAPILACACAHWMPCM